ncbi:unnamed protein product [Rotaria sp. Silwood1]|nr:unnamed protein product [Rotaria sp. Silwood1]
MANVFLQFLLDVENGDLDGVKRNIQNGIDLETRDEDQQTALILAARCNHFECVKVLIEAHADVNAEDVGQFTPLMWASYQGHTRVVEYLLSCGTNVNAQDEHGISSLSWASGRNHVDIVALLLAAGASPNLYDKNNTSPLIWASRRGYTRIVDLLLKHDANINNIGMKNMTALLAATKGGHAETALRLLENRTIDIKIQDKDGETPLSHACAQGLTDVVVELVQRHAYVNTVDKNGNPVLFSAVKGGKEDCVAILLENHADINAIGAENKTAIWWAVERGRLNVVKYLLQYNPDVEVAGGPDDDTPLLLATKRKRVAIVYELIKYGARLSSVDQFGDNSLYIALRNHSRDIADILLSNPRYSKYLYRPNKRGETPYKIDANLQKSILTTIFGQRTLNLNDDSILGYDLYSSALAEILSEPSLRTPITVTLANGTSALDVTVKPTTIKKLSKKKRRRQRRDTLPNTKPVSTSELTYQLLQSDYFLDINPRILQRLINIIAMTGRLLRANQVLFSWKRLGCWSYLVEQWPYRISWIVIYYEDHGQDYAEDTELKTLYNKIKPFIPITNDPLLELDRSGRKFELCIEKSEPVLNVTDLKQFLPCTCNLDPYLNKLIRESAAYFYMNNIDENGFVHGDPSRFFSPRDSTQ